MRIALLLLWLAALGAAQTKTSYEELPGYSLSNGRMEVVILTTGGTIASVVLADDKDKLNPLWNPFRLARESGSTLKRSGGGLGHFVCVDGFGGVSKEEAAAGMQGHGEAHRQQFEVTRWRNENGAVLLTLETELPLVQEHLTRTYEMREGENVLYVRSRLQSLVAFDRPLVWAEHATIGSPFLEPGVTAVDAPYKNAQTRPYMMKGDHRLLSGVDFEWPNAPISAKESVDIRTPPVKLGSGDHTTGTMDPSRQFAFATAINPEKKLIIGWIWRTADFPWLQNWESYPASGKLARGLEFSTQPYDLPRRDVVNTGKMFGVPTFQWLPAKSVLERSFAMFFAPLPEGMVNVSEVRLENGQLLVEDGKGHRLSLRASGAL